MKTIPLKRGFTEIEQLWGMVTDLNGIICGGYARYCASPKPTPKVKPAGDVDIFPKSEEASEAILKELINWGYEKIHENHVSITLKPKEGFETKLNHIPKPQIIKPMIEGRIVTLGSAEEIIDNFDFSVVRAAITSPTSVLVDEDFEEDELHNIIRIKNIHCPITSLLRACKYTRKGYWLGPAQALKLFIEWDSRGDEYKDKITTLFSKSEFGEKTKDNPNGITQKEIDELEALLRID